MSKTVVYNKNDTQICSSLLIHDKKNENGEIRFTLLEDIGKGIINQTVESHFVKEAFDDYMSY